MLATVLLAVVVALQLLSCLGVVLMRGPLDRLHYAGAVALPVLLAAVAVAVAEPFSAIALKAVLLAVFLVITGPVVSHVLARALAGT